MTKIYVDTTHAEIADTAARKNSGYWQAIAKTALRNITDDQAKLVADECERMEQQKSGFANVWHASSVVFGHRCNCRKPECVAHRLRQQGTLT